MAKKAKKVEKKKGPEVRAEVLSVRWEKAGAKPSETIIIEQAKRIEDITKENDELRKEITDRIKGHEELSKRCEGFRSLAFLALLPMIGSKTLGMARKWLLILWTGVGTYEACRGFDDVETSFRELAPDLAKVAAEIAVSPPRLILELNQATDRMLEGEDQIDGIMKRLGLV